MSIEVTVASTLKVECDYKIADNCEPGFEVRIESMADIKDVCSARGFILSDHDIPTVHCKACQRHLNKADWASRL